MNFFYKYIDPSGVGYWIKLISGKLDRKPNYKIIHKAVFGIVFKFNVFYFIKYGTINSPFKSIKDFKLFLLFLWKEIQYFLIYLILVYQVLYNGFKFIKDIIWNVVFRTRLKKTKEMSK